MISQAWAQAAVDTTTAAGGGLSGFLPLILIFVIFYFLLLRPQQKKIKAHHTMLTMLNRGDKVVTAGGIIGKITKVSVESPTVMVEIASGVEVEINKQTIAERVVKEEQKKTLDADSAEESKKKSKKK